MSQFFCVCQFNIPGYLLSFRLLDTLCCLDCEKITWIVSASCECDAIIFIEYSMILNKTQQWSQCRAMIGFLFCSSVNCFRNTFWGILPFSCVCINETFYRVCGTWQWCLGQQFYCLSAIAFEKVMLRSLTAAVHLMHVQRQSCLRGSYRTVTQRQ